MLRLLNQIKINFVTQSKSRAMSGLEKSVDEFTEEHVKGVIRPVDISNMPQMEAKEMEEQYDAEALRKASYIEFLCSKKMELAKRIHGTKYKDDFISKWKRFTNDRFSNLRRSDHPFNSGDSTALVRYCRSYRPPANGKPGRLRCVNSLQDIFRPVRNRLIEHTCEDFDQQCAAGAGALFVARRVGAKLNCLNALMVNPAAWKAAMQGEGYTKRAVKDALVIIWSCDPKDPKMRSFAKKIGRRFRDYEDLYEEVQALKLLAFKHADLQWALEHIHDNDNRVGRFFLLVLTTIESACTNTVVNSAVQHFGWKIMAIVHDGFNPMVKLNKQDQAYYCDVFHAICEALFPELNLKWCVKPFDFMM
jgi:hypothetical protein